VPHLWQGLCFDARPGDALADPQAFTQLWRLWQAVLPTLAAPGTPEIPHGREALWVCALRQGLCGSLQSSGTHANPFGGQELRVQAVPQDLRPEVVPQQALGVGLPEG